MFLCQDLITKSKFNGEIKLKKFFGRYSVWVGGFEQSGPLVQKLWQKALAGLHPALQGATLSNVLVLGLGCGSVLAPLRKRFPSCHIIGVEIDPVMIALGKEYFKLEEIPNLKIICQDATKLKLTTKFDLIISDLYCEGDIVFDPRTRSYLSPKGSIIVSYLRFGKTKEEKEKFMADLEDAFNIRQIIPAEYNDLFVCSL